MPTKQSADPETDRDRQERRDFLRRCGRFAVVTPPAMAILLTVSSVPQGGSRLYHRARARERLGVPTLAYRLPGGQQLPSIAGRGASRPAWVAAGVSPYALPGSNLAGLEETQETSRAGRR